jgi:hypothetical protein
MSFDEKPHIRTAIRVDQVVVNELTGRLVPHQHARAEARYKRADHQSRGGGDAQMHGWVHAVLVDRRDLSGESIALPGNRLNERGVRGESGSDPANGVIDAQVVFNDRVGPESRPDLFTRHDLAGAVDQQFQQLEGLSLQRNPVAAVRECSRLKVDDVLAELEATHERLAIIPGRGERQKRFASGQDH